MTRALRRYRSVTYARRAQRAHLRQAHPDGAVDCVCERSVWFFDKPSETARFYKLRLTAACP